MRVLVGLLILLRLSVMSQKKLFFKTLKILLQCNMYFLGRYWEFDTLLLCCISLTIFFLLSCIALHVLPVQHFCICVRPPFLLKVQQCGREDQIWPLLLPPVWIQTDTQQSKNNRNNILHLVSITTYYLNVFPGIANKHWATCWNTCTVCSFIHIKKTHIE